MRQWLVRRRPEPYSDDLWASGAPWVVYMPLDSETALEHSRWPSWGMAYSVAFEGAVKASASAGGS